MSFSLQKDISCVKKRLKRFYRNAIAKRTNILVLLMKNMLFSYIKKLNVFHVK